jgi:diguanylate cyclase (GGDEF)-like protein
MADHQVSMPDSPEKTSNLRGFRKAKSDTDVVPTGAAVRRAPPHGYLVCICPSGPGLGRRYSVGSVPVVLGRESTCTIPVADAGVSRAHARITRGTDGTYLIEDLTSTNGTYVNNTRIRSGLLRDGDYLRVGGQIFRFLAGDNVEAGYHEEIHRLTILDPLTGVHNRRYLDDYLEREVERARRHGRPLSVLLADIDHFKVVNDKFGHLAGDFALQGMAVRLIALSRKDELLARYGGEEFALVLPETDLERALLCGERIRRAVVDQPFEFEGEQYPVTISVGVATLAPDQDVTAADLLREADDRLYQAKRAGRNRVAPSVRIGSSNRVTPSPARTPPPATRADG